MAAYPTDNGRNQNVSVAQLSKSYEGAGLRARSVNTDTEAGNTMRVYSLKFHPDNEHIFISAGWDNHIKVSRILHSFCADIFFQLSVYLTLPSMLLPHPQI